LVALPSDVARARKAARDAYEDVLSMMAGLFECGLKDQNECRDTGRALRWRDYACPHRCRQRICRGDPQSDTRRRVSANVDPVACNPAWKKPKPV